jgi:hypothetical protein
VTFPVRGGEWTLEPDDLERYIRDFPKLDVPHELGSARLWLLDHPLRQKTQAGMRRFLSGWLRRSRQPQPSAASPLPSYAAWRCPHREGGDLPLHGSRWACERWSAILEARRERAEATPLLLDPSS